MPEDGERVLVSCEDIHEYVKQAQYDEMRMAFYDTAAKRVENDDVLAWMPLPEPYKEGEQ